MKIINLNNENLVKCKCGAVFEYEKSDLIFAKTELSNPFYDLSVRCPKCFNFISVYDNRNVFSISEFDEIINKNFQYKRIMLKDGSVVTLDIIGKNHDVDEKGNKTDLTLCFHDIIAANRMNKRLKNKGGWRDSCLREWLNEEFFDLLPDWLQKKIVSVIKKTSEDGKIVETVDKIFIPSEIEVFGQTKYSQEGEGEQYEFFKDWHNRIKGLEEDKYSTWYWLRSPYSGNSDCFCSVTPSGGYSANFADFTYGVVPCFSI